MTTLSYSRDNTEFSVEVETLPATSIAYLLQYGWAQSLQDAIAGRAKAVLQEVEDGIRAQLIEDAKPNDPNPATIDARVAEIMQEKAAETRAQVIADLLGTLGKRADAIKSGTVGTRTARIGSPFDAMCKKVATEMLLAALKAKNTKRPKPEAFDALLVQVLEKHREKIEAEATRRIDAANTIGLDVDIEA